MRFHHAPWFAAAMMLASRGRGRLPNAPKPSCSRWRRRCWLRTGARGPTDNGALTEHARELVVQRKSAREQPLLVQFLALSPRAIDDGLEPQAFSAEYIANIPDARRRMAPEPAALQLTRRADLLELELPEPDLSIYERHGDDGCQHRVNRPTPMPMHCTRIWAR